MASTNELILDIVTEGVSRGIGQLYHSGKTIQNNQLTVNGEQLLSFSSCSYLGLEYDERLRNAAKQAIDAYGTQFSSSRTYISLGMYEELEALLAKMFGHAAIVSPTTTLGHIAALPVLIEQGDAVIIDHQVHHSVQTAAGLLRARRIHTEMIRHNNMEMLEQRILHLKDKHRNIWYLADGVYSMYGDLCKTDDITALLAKYPQLRFYVDDAHGMSYMGPNGSGFICSRMQLNEQMVLATSLNKAFATGGGTLIIPDNALSRKVRYCGSTFITSGPLQPASLGAGIASARLHLSDEMPALQKELADKIKFCALLLGKAGLPLIAHDNTAIFFIGLGTPKLGYRLVDKMMRRGFLMNLGIFPAVPIKNTGLRFTITRMHTYAEISRMVAALAAAFEETLAEEGVAIETIYKAFNMQIAAAAARQAEGGAILGRTLQLKAEHHTSVLDISAAEWNAMFLGRGAFDWNALAMLEHSFSGHTRKENNWHFDYLIIRDSAGAAVAATFTTTALVKDDLQSPAAVSRRVEEMRAEDPYLLTSVTTTTGCGLTEGEHIFIDAASPLKKEALTLLLHELSAIADERGANTLLVRDMLAVDEETTSHISENGFFRVAMPDAHIHDGSAWSTMEEFYSLLSRERKGHFRAKVRKDFDAYEYRPVTTPDAGQTDAWYRMYLDVKTRNLELNTFPIPKQFFEDAVHTAGWDVCELRHKASDALLGVMFSYKSGDLYVPTIVGLDYSLLDTHFSYKRILFATALRAKELGCTRVSYGFGASQEKRKIAAEPIPAYAFVQTKDSFNAEFIGNMQINETAQYQPNPSRYTP